MLHFVAFCCIFLVIVKFVASPGAPGTGQVGEAAWFSFVVFAPYRAILRHFLVVVRVGGLQPLMDSVGHAFLFVKLGKSVEGTAISCFSIEQRGRATTRVAPTTGWPGGIFRGIAHAALWPAHRGMKMGEGAIRESPLREVGWESTTPWLER